MGELLLSAMLMVFSCAPVPVFSFSGGRPNERAVVVRLWYDAMLFHDRTEIIFESGNKLPLNAPYPSI
jgi:hypothetical protein